MNWIAESDQAHAEFGWAAGTAGDVNGDGYSDVIIGAPFYDYSRTNEGRAYVYHGTATGLFSKALWIARGNQGFARFGWAVGTAGDVNGDGYSDIIIGAPYYDNEQTDEGRAYGYYGGVSSLGLSPKVNWIVESDQANALFGWAVGTAGDVNGDGADDVIIGAPSYDNAQTDEGRAYVYHGSTGGVPRTAD